MQAHARSLQHFSGHRLGNPSRGCPGCPGCPDHGELAANCAQKALFRFNLAVSDPHSFHSSLWCGPSSTHVHFASAIFYHHHSPSKRNNYSRSFFTAFNRLLRHPGFVDRLIVVLIFSLSGPSPFISFGKAANSPAYHQYHHLSTTP